MKKIIILTALFLILLPVIQTKAKTEPYKDIENIVASHKVFVDRLIQYWEFRQEEINLLAEVIYHENWHTDKEHLAAYYTGAVVMNRVRSEEWPSTIRAVLFQRGQYATTGKFFTVDLPEECYEMAEDILKHGTPDVPEGVVFQSMQKGLGRGHWKVINGEYFAYG